MHLTTKQIEALTVIAKGNSDGTPADLDEILMRLSYKPTKQAVQFTIRSLIDHGLIEKGGMEKRRGRMRVVIKATDLGKHFAGVHSIPLCAAIVEADDIPGLEV